MLGLFKRKAQEVHGDSQLAGRESHRNTQGQHNNTRFAFLALLAVVLALSLIAGSFQINPSALTSPGSTIGNLKTVFTIGTVEASVAPDYTVDGTADDVQFQAALNALPSTGGELKVVSSGTFQFAATVSRAINNVTISGTGIGTYFAYNGATAIFSAGAQSGWVFRDFKTDAGGITLTSASYYTLENIVVNTTRYAYKTALDINWQIPVGPKENLLPNSGFGVMSAATGATFGAAVAVSAYTNGANHVICTTTNTQGLRVGKNIVVTAGDASLQTCWHTITALTTNTSFEFNMEAAVLSAGGGGAITVYEAVPYTSTIADYLCDGEGLNYWKRTGSIAALYRIESKDLTTGIPSFYCLKLVKAANTPENIWYSWLKTTYSPEVKLYSGRQMVFGMLVWATTATTRIYIDDGVTKTYSSYAPANALTWLEVTATIGAYDSISKIEVGYEMAGAIGEIHYPSCPQFSFGSYLGNLNYSPIKNELVNFTAHVSPTHRTGAAVTASNRFKLEGETNAKIPKNIKAILTAFEGNGDTAGDSIQVFRGPISDPLTQGVTLGCQVAGIINFAGMSTIQVSEDIDKSVYLTKNGAGTWTTSFDICGVIIN
jgi:hypothetical protein